MNFAATTVAAALDEIQAAGFDVSAAREHAGETLSLPIIWSTRYKTKAGCCEYKRTPDGVVPTRLVFNPRLQLEGPKAFVATFLHELAHAMLPYGEKHSATWRSTLYMIGGRDLGRCHTYKSMSRENAHNTLVLRTGHRVVAMDLSDLE